MLPFIPLDFQFKTRLAVSDFNNLWHLIFIALGIVKQAYIRNVPAM